jgi:uncharacterized protein involved in exopolysaccharide biosynthesis
MVALAASDRNLAANAVSKSGRFSRGTAYTKKLDTMELLATAIPIVVPALLDQAKEGLSVADLQAEQQGLNETISNLRAQLEEATAQISALSTYAAELHHTLKPEYEENLRTRAERVVDMKPRLRPVPSGSDDGEG